MNFKMPSTRGLAKMCNHLAKRARRSSPELAIVVGIATGIGAIVSACHATTKLPETIEHCNVRLERARAIPVNDVITENDVKKEVAKAYVANCVDVVKLYTLPAALEAVSVLSIIGGHRIMKQRNIALLTAYTAVTESFGKYRGGVVERYGEEADRQLFYGVAGGNKVLAEVTDASGNTVTVEELNAQSSNPTDNPFARWWSDSAEYVADEWYARQIFKGRETYFTNLLRSERHVTLNDVYAELGFEPTVAGYNHGWVYDRGAPVDHNQVCFRATKMWRTPDPARPEHQIEDWYLDFNVHGEIATKLIENQVLALV